MVPMKDVHHRICLSYFKGYSDMNLPHNLRNSAMYEDSQPHWLNGGHLRYITPDSFRECLTCTNAPHSTLDIISFDFHLPQNSQIYDTSLR